jgi:hypothetical protein
MEIEMSKVTKATKAAELNSVRRYSKWYKAMTDEIRISKIQKISAEIENMARAGRCQIQLEHPLSEFEVNFWKRQGFEVIPIFEFGVEKGSIISWLEAINSLSNQKA